VPLFSNLSSDSPLIFVSVWCMYLGASSVWDLACPCTMPLVRASCAATASVAFALNLVVLTCTTPSLRTTCSAERSRSKRCSRVLAHRRNYPPELAIRLEQVCWSTLRNIMRHMHSQEGRIIMSASRGSVRFAPLFTTDDIGLPKTASVEHIIKVFLAVGEAVAARWIEMPRGILLLQTVPDQSATGAIYLYDRERQLFFFVDFVDGRDDTLTAMEFDQLVVEYDLVSWAGNPAFLPAQTRSAAVA
jgi:hypothetical protein